MTVTAAVGVVAVAAVPGFLLGGWTSALLCLGGAAASGVLLVPLWARRRFDLFEPLSWVLLATFFGTTLKAAYVVFGQGVFIEEYVLRGRHLGLLTDVLPVVVAGLAALSVGYMLPVPGLPVRRTFLARNGGWDDRLVFLTVGVALAVSMASGLYFVQRMDLVLESLSDLSAKRFVYDPASGSRGALGYVRWGMSLAGPAFFVLLIRRMDPAVGRAGRWATVAMVLAGFLAVFYPFFNSSRQGAMVVVTTALVIVHYMRGGLPLRRVMILGVAVIALFATMTTLRSFRPGESPSILGSLGPGLVAEELVGGRHFLDLAKTAHIIDGVPERVGYERGATLFGWLIAPIPRSFWPGKPALGSGPQLSAAIFDANASAVPAGFVAELVLNFGLLGVLPGMFLAGLGLQVLAATARDLVLTPNGILVYAVITQPLAFQLFETDLSKALVLAVVALIPALLITWVLSRPMDRASYS